MALTLLSDRDSQTLRSTGFSFEAVGEGFDAAPPGFLRHQRSRILRRRDFESAVHDLLSWRAHERAGLRVAASDIPLREGTVVLMRLGVGPLSLRIPCRVTTLINEPQRRGFSYATLVGHPEVGEERFVLEHLNDGRIRFTITAISRPASRLARISGPMGRRFQLFMTERYLKALLR